MTGVRLLLWGVAFAAALVHLGCSGVEWVWRLAVALPVSMILQDLLSALVHIWLDRLGSPATPIVGHLVAGFRRHHVDPAAIVVENGVLDSTLDAAWFSTAVALLVLTVPVDRGADFAFVGAVIAGVSFFSLVTQPVHVFAHHPQPPRWVKFLQRWHLMIPPHVHARHHTGRRDTHYAVLTGWTNGLVDRLRFAEWLAARPRDRSAVAGCAARDLSKVSPEHSAPDCAVRRYGGRARG